MIGKLVRLEGVVNDIKEVGCLEVHIGHSDMEGLPLTWEGGDTLVGFFEHQGSSFEGATVHTIKGCSQVIGVCVAIGVEGFGDTNTQVCTDGGTTSLCGDASREDKVIAQSVGVVTVQEYGDSPVFGDVIDGIPGEYSAPDVGHVQGEIQRQGDGNVEEYTEVVTPDRGSPGPDTVCYLGFQGLPLSGIGVVVVYTLEL